MRFLARRKKGDMLESVQTYAMIRRVDSKETLAEIREARMHGRDMIE